MKYEFRIHGFSVNEVHIFENGGDKSICGRVTKTGTKEMGIYKDGRYLFPFSELSKDQARDLASTLDFLGISVCGTCVSHLYKTLGG